MILTLFSIHRSSTKLRHSRYSHWRSSSPPDLLFPVLSKRDDTKELFLRIDRLGISGKELLRFFKVHLLRIMDVDHRQRAAKNTAGVLEPMDVAVSQYYDLFKQYLYTDYTNQDFNDNNHGSGDVGRGDKCAPYDSIVARLTKGVDPRPIHSHNDYWRKIPLFEALAFGASSVEADVWIVPETRDETNDNNDENGEDDDSGMMNQFALAVGHNEDYLDPVNQNLDQLYTKPLRDMLDQVNCRGTSKKNGVFFNSPETTLLLYIDFKSMDSEMTYHLLMDKYLKPLIDQEYISFYDMEMGKVVYNQITIILTGNYPKDREVINNGNGDEGYYYSGKRHVFLDADLLDLESMIPNTSITSSASFDDIMKHCSISKAKTMWTNHLVRSHINCIRSLIDENHEKNLKTRIWGVPAWPENTLKTLWRQQVYDIHSDLLNVDDLHRATSF